MTKQEFNTRKAIAIAEYIIEFAQQSLYINSRRYALALSVLGLAAAEYKMEAQIKAIQGLSYESAEDRAALDGHSLSAGDTKSSMYLAMGYDINVRHREDREGEG